MVHTSTYTVHTITIIFLLIIRRVIVIQNADIACICLKYCFKIHYFWAIVLRMYLNRSRVFIKINQCSLDYRMQCVDGRVHRSAGESADSMNKQQAQVLWGGLIAVNAVQCQSPLKSLMLRRTRDNRNLKLVEFSLDCTLRRILILV